MDTKTKHKMKHKMKPLSVIAGFVFFALLTACSSTFVTEELPLVIQTSVPNEVKPSIEIASMPLTRSQQNAVEMSSSYAFRALNNMHRLVPDKSSLISPVGYSVLLPMVSELCGDEFKTKIISELSIGEVSFEGFREAVSKMIESMPALDLSTEVSFANLALAVNIARRVYSDDVQNALESYYNALVAEGKRSSVFIESVNNWIKKHTLGRIKGNLIGASPVFFASMFEFQASLNPGFDTRQTRNGAFYGAPENPVFIPMMHARYPVPYLQAETFDAIKLYFGEQKKFSFTAILPHDGIELSEILTELEKNGIPKKWIQGEVDITLPKISLNGGIALGTFNETLSNIVDRRFSELIGKIVVNSEKETYGIVQMCSITLDETGLKGHSKTVMDVLDSAMDGTENGPGFVFNANRPFIFTIEVEGTGIALYTGLYCNQGFDN